MTSFGTVRFWQAACTACLFSALVVAALCPSVAVAQQKRYRPIPDYVQLRRPDQELGRKVLDEFRNAGAGDAFYLEFQLRVLPRRGPERSVTGRLWDTRIESIAHRRIELDPPSTEEGKGSTRLLVVGGARPKVWRWRQGSALAIETLGGSSYFERLSDTDLTPFDLQMPFLDWPEFEFEGVRKVRGRPAHAFLFYPPVEWTEWQPTLTGVRVFLDTQYNALVQVEQLGDRGVVEKSVSVLDLKKWGERWMVKTIDVRNEITRNKTRFSVTAAALELTFSQALFSPDELGTAFQPPRTELTRVEP
jgi:hypothetical protein